MRRARGRYGLASRAAARADVGLERRRRPPGRAVPDLGTRRRHDLDAGCRPHLRGQDRRQHAGNYPSIDDLRDGEATSLKTMDLVNNHQGASAQSLARSAWRSAGGELGMQGDDPIGQDPFLARSVLMDGRCQGPDPGRAVHGTPPDRELALARSVLRRRRITISIAAITRPSPAWIGSIASRTSPSRSDVSPPGSKTLGFTSTSWAPTLDPTAAATADISAKVNQRGASPTQSAGAKQKVSACGATLASPAAETHPASSAAATATVKTCGRCPPGRGRRTRDTAPAIKLPIATTTTSAATQS